MVGVACVVCWPWVRLGEDEGRSGTATPLQCRFGACQEVGAVLGATTLSMAVGKGVILASFQELKRRHLRRFCKPPYRHLDAVQGPSDADEGRRFRRHTTRRSGAIQGAPQPSFRRHWRLHLQCRSQRHARRIPGAIQAHSRCIPSVIQAHSRRHSGVFHASFRHIQGSTFQALQRRRSGAPEASFQAIQTMCRGCFSGVLDANEKCRFWALQASVPGVVQGSFSHRSGVVLTPLIPPVMASF